MARMEGNPAARDEWRRAKLDSEVAAARQAVMNLPVEILPAAPCLGTMPQRAPAPRLEDFRGGLPLESDPAGPARSEAECDDALAAALDRLQAAVASYRANLERLGRCLVCCHFERCRVLSGR
ncbi:MAG: hypothetical protein AB1609_23060 [Bacillota bacterium]